MGIGKLSEWTWRIGRARFACASAETGAPWPQRHSDPAHQRNARIAHENGTVSIRAQSGHQSISLSGMPKTVATTLATTHTGITAAGALSFGLLTSRSSYP